MIRDRTGTDARSILALDRAGYPVCRDRARIYTALRAVRRAGDPDLIANGFLAGVAARLAEHIRPLLTRIDAATFVMGTDTAKQGHFCGEVPGHRVELSVYAVTRVQVTNRLFALLDPDRAGCASAADLPVTDVTWFDAAVFADWVGCRLPTEAEWEYACGCGDPAQWSCGAAERLPDVAWYSENAGGRPHPVGTREPNAAGLYDMHGNAWEWCQDDYDADWYAHSPVRDPVNGGTWAASAGPATHKVARGGGYLALEEMCRTRFRLHDPAEYWAPDLGFRLVAGSGTDGGPPAEGPAC
jgi:formylglycine-generating enzyme required for sulfatase activity